MGKNEIDRSEVREKYRGIVEQDERIPLFFRVHWLDAVCGPAGWQPIVAEEAGRPLGILPVPFTRKGPFRGMGMPLMTPFLGYWLCYPPGLSNAHRLNFEEKAVEALFRLLPAGAFYEQVLHQVNTNWLPLYWAGFRQSGRITYMLEDITDPARVWEGFPPKTRAEIRKAGRQVSVHNDGDIEAVYDALQQSLRRQGRRLLASRALLGRIDEACRRHRCGRAYVARDGQGRVHAAGYVVWDEQCAYFLARGGDHSLMPSGAMSLLTWRMIEDLHDQTRAFDFVGSELPGVEHFVRGFGSRQVSRHFIARDFSAAYRLTRLGLGLFRP